MADVASGNLGSTVIATGGLVIEALLGGDIDSLNQQLKVPAGASI